MNVSLTPELQAFVTKKVESGMYQTASEVVRESLRLMRERDDLYREKIEALRKEIAYGIEELDQGKRISFNESTLKRIKANGRNRVGNAK